MIERPAFDDAFVERKKIVEYLLSTKHPVGRAKAAVFRAMGFRAIAWHALRDALLKHAKEGKLVSATETTFGKKYVVEGPLIGSNGQSTNVRAVWFVEPGETTIRFVTAYRIRGSDT